MKFISNHQKINWYSAKHVEDVIVGQIGELMLLHAHNNHNELGQDDGRSAERLYKTMQKMYGPQVLNSPRKKRLLFIWGKLNEFQKYI